MLTQTVSCPLVGSEAATVAFKKVNLYKAPGPESIPGHVLRARVTCWQR